MKLYNIEFLNTNQLIFSSHHEKEVKNTLWNLIIQVNIINSLSNKVQWYNIFCHKFEWMNKLLLYCIATINRSTHLLNHMKIDTVSYQSSLYNYILTIYKWIHYDENKNWNEEIIINHLESITYSPSIIFWKHNTSGEIIIITI